MGFGSSSGGDAESGPSATRYESGLAVPAEVGVLDKAVGFEGRGGGFRLTVNSEGVIGMDRMEDGEDARFGGVSRF